MIKDESTETSPNETLTENHLNGIVNSNSNEKKDCIEFMESKSSEMDDLPDADPIEPVKSKFQPKVPPTDYERFIYKCEHCLLGFKRRGKALKYDFCIFGVFFFLLKIFLQNLIHFFLQECL